MSSIEDEIEEVKKEIRETPYNKSTEQHIGRLKAKLARLKEEKAKKAEKQAGGGRGYSVEKTGDATVIMVGYPSVGKSTLLNSLTGADTEVADYEFTTLEVNPGMMKYKGANIQILDVPGLISGASEGRGRGREVISVVRNADLLLIMLDSFELEQYEEVEEELYKAGIRINEDPPNVKIQERGQGGIEINSTVELTLGDDEIRSILEENGIVNANVTIREDLDTDRLIDAVMTNREYLPALVIINKSDLLDESQLKEKKELADDKIDEETIFISAEHGDLKILREKIFENLGLIRVYMKPQGEEVDKEEPMIIEEGSTVEELSKKIHRDLKKKFKHARVWGESAKYPGQEVGGSHVLADEDVVRIVS